MIHPYGEELHGMFSVLVVNQSIHQPVLKHLHLHTRRCDVRLLQDDWVGGHLLNEVVLVCLHISWLHAYRQDQRGSSWIHLDSLLNEVVLVYLNISYLHAYIWIHSSMK